MKPLRDWSRLRSFLWGSLLGSVLGFLLAPRHRRDSTAPVVLEPWDELAGAPCAKADDGYR